MSLSCRKRIFIELLALGCFLITSMPARGQSAEEIIKRVKQRHEAIKQVCADFTQTFHWKMADETQTTKGSICAENGIKFKIENQDQLIVTDGKTIWTQNKMNKQLMIDYAGNSAEDNPLLQSFFKKYIEEYQAELLGNDKIGEIAYYHLKLSAKSDDQFVHELELWVNQKTFYLYKVKQEDVNGNSTVYEVENINPNVQLSDDSFTLTAPEGYEVIDLR
jgi:outer membrane lipoprotein-sorting protein